MAASLQDFRSLIDYSPDAISLINAEGNILYGSASSAKIFGYQPEDLVGRKWLDLIHPQDRDYANRALNNVLAKPPGPLQWDARIRRKNGNYSWVENSISNVLFEFEVHAIVVYQRDINARRAAEVERQRQAEEVIIAPKLYRLLIPTLALILENGRHVARTVPAGAIIAIARHGLVTTHRLVDIQWNGETVVMFTDDLRARTQRTK